MDSDSGFGYRAVTLGPLDQPCAGCPERLRSGQRAIKIARGPDALPPASYTLYFSSRYCVAMWAQAQGLDLTTARRTNPAAWARNAGANEAREAAFFDLYEAAIRPNPVCQLCPKDATIEIAFWGEVVPLNPSGRGQRFACRDHLAQLEREVESIPEIQGRESREVL